VFAAALLLAGVVDKKRPQRVQVQSRYVGSLPVGAQSLNFIGYLQLLTAALLINEAYVLDELSDKVNPAAGQWLGDLRKADSLPAIAQLLAEAGALLIRIQGSDEELGRMAESRRKLVDAWVTAYSEVR
jgi:hypothetical protein